MPDAYPATAAMPQAPDQHNESRRLAVISPTGPQSADPKVPAAQRLLMPDLPDPSWGGFVVDISDFSPTEKAIQLIDELGRLISP